MIQSGVIDRFGSKFHPMARRRQRNQLMLSSGFDNQKSQKFETKVKLRENFRSEGQTIDTDLNGE